MKEVQPIEEAPLPEKAGTELSQADAVEEKEAPKEEEPGATPAVLPIPEHKTLVYFKHNSNDLEDQFFETLNRIAAFMLQSPTAKVSIKGYTDSTGNSSYNISVSQFRANIIKTYLVGKGVNPANIDAVGLGAENPIATNATEDGRRRNRRVEIELNPI
jgi:general secretion pathway protein A